MVVAPHGHIVFRQALDSRSVEESCVSDNRVDVGQWIKGEVRYNRCVDVCHGVRIRSGTWLARPRERFPVYNSNRRLAIWTDPARCRRRNGIGERVALPLPDPFIISEDEGLTLSDRTSAGCPKLVAMEGR